MRKKIAAFYDKHPVITVVLAIVLAINLIPLAVFSIKVAIPLLLVAGVVALVVVLSRGQLGSRADSKRLRAR